MNIRQKNPASVCTCTKTDVGIFCYMTIQNVPNGQRIAYAIHDMNLHVLLTEYSDVVLLELLDTLIGERVLGHLLDYGIRNGSDVSAC